MRAYVLAHGGGGGAERPEPETELGSGPGRGRCERRPADPGGGDGAGAGGTGAEPGNGAGGPRVPGWGGWSRTSSPRGCRDSGRSAAAITDFLWDKRTGLAARTVSARAGERGVAREDGDRGRAATGLGARDGGEVGGEEEWGGEGKEVGLTRRYPGRPT